MMKKILAATIAFVLIALSAAAQPASQVGPGPQAITYITGTFTPAFTFGGGCTSCTFSAQVGSYTRIGNRVFVSGIVALSSKGGGASTGTWLLTGLPCTSDATTNNDSASVLAANNLLSTVNGSVEGWVPANSTTSGLYILLAGVRTTMDDTYAKDNSSIAFSIQYPVSSCP